MTYNRQSNSLVYGAELGLNLLDTDLQDKSTHPFSTGFYHYDYKQMAKANGLMTLKGRAGYAFGNSLLAINAGVAVSSLKTGIDYVDSYTGSGQFTAHRTKSDNKVGWVAGASYEYLLSDSLALKADYQHVDFGKTSLSTPTRDGTGAFVSNMNFSAKVRMDTFMVGIEKKF